MDVLQTIVIDDPECERLSVCLCVLRATVLTLMSPLLRVCDFAEKSRFVGESSDEAHAAVGSCAAREVSATLQPRTALAAHGRHGGSGRRGISQLVAPWHVTVVSATV